MFFITALVVLFIIKIRFPRSKSIAEILKFTEWDGDCPDKK
jgi:hypothetical protein